MIIYKSNVLALAIIMGICVIGFGGFALLGPTDISNVIEVVIYAVLLLGSIVFVVSLTRIKISKNGELHYSEAGFIKKRASIKNIAEVDRNSTYRGLGVFGYSMFIYHEQNSEEKHIRIGENQFDKKTIKSFVNDLARINPDIKFHKHYQKMLKK